MAGYTVEVKAATQSAVSDLKRLQDLLDKVTKARDIIVKIPQVKEFQKNAQRAAKMAAQGFVKVSSATANLATNIELVSRLTDPRRFMRGSFAAANAGANSLLDKLSKITVVLYGIKAATSLVTNTFAGFFNSTIGAADEFNMTLLKTKTTLASTADIFEDGKKITDPLKAIEAYDKLRADYPSCFEGGGAR